MQFVNLFLSLFHLLKTNKQKPISCPNGEKKKRPEYPAHDVLSPNWSISLVVF